MTVSWSADWRCSDCGEKVPIAPGEDTQPISESHECDSTRLAIHQASLAAWEDGYKFALRNYDDDLVQADAREPGTGWLRHIGRGHIEITAEGDE